MSDYDSKIERGLILYLREEYDIKARTAELGETEVERAMFEGCETCGYGGEDDVVYFHIRWRDEHGIPHLLRENGSSLNFFPKLLAYIDRAN